jgi:hypothetical protein
VGAKQFLTLENVKHASKFIVLTGEFLRYSSDGAFTDILKINKNNVE